jgi:hypothetical protein
VSEQLIVIASQCYHVRWSTNIKIRFSALFRILISESQEGLKETSLETKVKKKNSGKNSFCITKKRLQFRSLNQN